MFATAAAPDLSPWYVLLYVLVVSLASAVGSLFIYGLAGLLGKDRLFRGARRLEKYHLLSLGDLERVFDYFERKGHWVVFFGRMAPTIRTLVSIPPGIIRMPIKLFLLYTLMGTLVWNVIIGYIFYFFWINAEAIRSILGIYASVCAGLIVIVAVWLIGKNLVKGLLRK